MTSRDAQREPADSLVEESFFLPDRATCPACLKEIFDPASRRYRDPFASCPDCGPRYSIARSLPIERGKTSMATFPPCETCREEIADPGNRRHDYALVSCPDCGPAYWIEPTPHRSGRGDVVAEIAHLLKQGKILAIKGSGGFHLSCLATDENLVQRLRRRMQRRTKPMAVMVPDLEWARKICHLNTSARGRLKDPCAPIVVAPKRHPELLAHSVAPESPDYGLTLPSTPFRHLLMDALGQPLVVTAAKFADDHLIFDNEEARNRLLDVVDHLVLHDREIEMPSEDTVLRVQGDDVVITRRSWGQAPRPLRLTRPIPRILGLGALHRATVALGFDRTVVLSQHLGELDAPTVEVFYRRTLSHLQELFSFQPEHVAYDLQPESLGRRIAQEMQLPSTGVQHHHAHVASVMAEHGLPGPVLGLALDSAGWGEDDTLWGSEFLLGDAASVQRVDHGPCFWLPGGTSAFTHPWRSAAGLIWELRGEEAAATWLKRAAPDPVAADNVLSLLRDGIDCLRSCGLGVLYDALASILGILDRQAFDGQAPMSLERLAGPPHAIDEGSLPDPDEPAPAYFGAVLDRLLVAVYSGRDLAETGAWIEKAVAFWVARRAVRLAHRHGVDTVVASGGCMVNAWLRHELRSVLAAEGLRFFTNEAIPPNDGGIAVGQVQVAAERLRRA